MAEEPHDPHFNVDDDSSHDSDDPSNPNRQEPPPRDGEVVEVRNKQRKYSSSFKSKLSSLRGSFLGPKRFPCN